MSIKLPETYYDERSKNSPFLFECIRQDLRTIEKRNLTGPFFDGDNFPGMNRHFEKVITALGHKLSNNFRQIAGRDELLYRSLIDNFQQSDGLSRETFFHAVDYLTLLNFTLYGRKSFFFTDNLVEHLIHTELDAPSTHIRLPIITCLFVITSPAVIKSLRHLPGRPPVSKEPLSIFLTEAETSEEERGVRKIIITCYQNVFEEKPLLVKRSLLIRDDWSIKQMLQTNWEEIFGGKNEDNPGFGDDEAFYSNEGIVLFYRALMNCILYIQSKDADIISKLSPHRRAGTMNRKEREQELFLSDQPKKEVSKLDYEMVGESIPPMIIKRVVDESGDNEKANGEESSRTAAASEHNKMGKRILVRGHWRNQAHGENFSERKLIWIKPFYKGPEIAEMIERPIIVK